MTALMHDPARYPHLPGGNADRDLLCPACERMTDRTGRPDVVELARRIVAQHAHTDRAFLTVRDLERLNLAEAVARAADLADSLEAASRALGESHRLRDWAPSRRYHTEARRIRARLIGDPR